MRQFNFNFVRVDSRLPERAELAWVRLEGLGAVSYIAVRRSEDGVTDYEEQLSSALDTEQGDLVWRLTIERVTREMAGFYQCEVREYFRRRTGEKVPGMITSRFHELFVINLKLFL